MGAFGALLKLLLLRAQRKDKVATMRWDNVRDGVWTIPTAKREKSNAKPPAVLDIINGQPRIPGNPYVFACRGTGPFNTLSQDKQKTSIRNSATCRRG
jgi:hypothetical protein